MVAVFAVTLFLDDSLLWVEWVRASAEAGMIGGLVDWFAVVTIFRHPLGISWIKPTIPKNKPKVVKNFGRFIEKHFSDPDEVADRVLQANVSSQIANWLSQQSNTENLAAHIVTVVSKLGTPQTDVKNILRDEVVGRMKHAEVAPVCGQLLNMMYDKGYHHTLIREAAIFFKGFLNKNPGMIEKLVSKQTGFLLGFLDQKIADSVEKSLHEWLDKLSDDDSPLKRELNGAIEKIVDELQRGQGIAPKLEEMKVELLDSPLVYDLLERVFEDIRDEFLGPGKYDVPKLQKTISGLLQQTGESLGENNDLQKEFDARLAEVARGVGPSAVRTVANYGTSVLDRWSAEDLSKTLEENVGEDLQTIRINGTIMGCGVGAIIFGFVHFLT